MTYIFQLFLTIHNKIIKFFINFIINNAFLNFSLQPRQLYKYELENLTFSSEYKVGIRASDTKNMRESALFWQTFKVPSCVEWHNYNFNICGKLNEKCY